MDIYTRDICIYKDVYHTIPATLHLSPWNLVTWPMLVSYQLTESHMCKCRKYMCVHLYLICRLRYEMSIHTLEYRHVDTYVPVYDG